MNAYDVCEACACHIKRQENECPFCGAQHTPKPRLPMPSVPRLSRAQWLAFGSSLAVTGCLDATAPAGAGASIDAAVVAHCPSPDTFLCSQDLDGALACCNRSTDVCFLTHSMSPAYCIPANTNLMAANNGSPSDCLTVVSTPLDDAGAIAVQCYGQCYGSPPARLRRRERVIRA